MIVSFTKIGVKPIGAVEHRHWGYHHRPERLLSRGQDPQCHTTGHRDHDQTRGQCQRRDAPRRQPLRRQVVAVVERPGVGRFGLSLGNARHLGQFVVHQMFQSAASCQGQ